MIPEIYTSFLCPECKRERDNTVALWFLHLLQNWLPKVRNPILKPTCTRPRQVKMPITRNRSHNRSRGRRPGRGDKVTAGDLGARVKPGIGTLITTPRMGTTSPVSPSLVLSAEDSQLTEQLRRTFFQEIKALGLNNQSVYEHYARVTPKMNLLRTLQTRLWKLCLLLLNSRSTLNVQMQNTCSFFSCPFMTLNWLLSFMTLNWWLSFMTLNWWLSLWNIDFQDQSSSFHDVKTENGLSWQRTILQDRKQFQCFQDSIYQFRGQALRLYVFWNI